MIKDSDGNWMCILCYEEHLGKKKYEQLGIELPWRAEIPKGESAVRHGFNRAARRRARRTNA